MILTASSDGSTALWDLITGEEIQKIYFFDDDPSKWLHLHPSGLFDASPEAMKLMYYTYGLEVIEFEQLKNLYWEPGLWEKAMSKEKLRSVPSPEELKKYLPPKLDYPRELKPGQKQIPVKIEKRAGGLGKIRVYVNGVEVDHDLNSKVDRSRVSQTVYYKIDPRNELPGGRNNITIIAETANGKVTSNKGQGLDVVNEENKEDPAFFGVFIGVGDYPDDNNQDLDLKYATKDIEAIDEALRLATPSLFKERTYYSLSTESKNRDSVPTKTNIERVFEEISRKARPNDMIWVHYSGHGKAISSSGNEEDKDIHLLLKDWVNINLEADFAKELIKNRTLSGDELKELLKKIKANKRVVVLDACEAGSFYDAKSGGNSIARSMDRLRTASGAAMIMGSQEDQKSYQTSNFEMGLLTYALLEGMKNTTVANDINSFELMRHAEERVPDLAKQLNVTQQPKIIGTANFPVGRLGEQELTKFPSLKGRPVIGEIRLLSKTTPTRDPLRLSTKLATKFTDYTAGNDVLFSFFNKPTENPTHYVVAGFYTENPDGSISIEIDIYNNNKELKKTINHSKEHVLDEILKEVALFLMETDN